MSFSNLVINDEDHLNINLIEEEAEAILTSLEGNTIGRNSEFIFKSVDTTGTGLFLIFSMLGLFIVSAVIPVECEISMSCYVKPLSVLLYLHCLLWGISLICDQHIQYQHIKVRRRGYLDFYNETRTLSQLPFWVVSTWSTLLLTTTTILHDYCHSEAACGKTIRLTKAEYVTVIIGLETVVLIATLMAYLRHVWHFNSTKSAPDVLRDDLMSSTLDFGPNSLGPLDEEVYERQADMIRYYQEHNAMLRKRVLELNRQLPSTTLMS